MKKEIKQMKIKSIETLLGDGTFRQLKNVFASLPDEEDIMRAVNGDMKSFLEYVKESVYERENPDSSCMGMFDYSEVRFETSLNGNNEYLSQVTFITPTSDRVITLSERSEEEKEDFTFEFEKSDYTITIDFGDEGSSYAADDYLSHLKINSYFDDFTRVEWIDGSITSAVDYKMKTVKKLSLRRNSRTTCNQYDKIMNRSRSFVIFTGMPQVDLLAHPCELLVDQMNDFDGDLVNLIESSYYKQYYRKIFLDQETYDLIFDKLSDMVKEVLTIVPRELVDGDSVLVYIKEESRMMGITYIKD